MSYRLRHNGDCWVVQTRRVRGEDAKNAGEVYWAESRYYPKLEQAARKLLDIYMAEEDSVETMKIVQALNDLCDGIKNAESAVIAHINQVTAE